MQSASGSPQHNELEHTEMFAHLLHSISVAWQKATCHYMWRISAVAVIAMDASQLLLEWSLECLTVHDAQTPSFLPLMQRH